MDFNLIPSTAIDRIAEMFEPIALDDYRRLLYISKAFYSFRSYFLCRTVLPKEAASRFLKAGGVKNLGICREIEIAQNVSDLSLIKGVSIVHLVRGSANTINGDLSGLSHCDYLRIEDVAVGLKHDFSFSTLSKITTLKLTEVTLPSSNVLQTIRTGLESLSLCDVVTLDKRPLDISSLAANLEHFSLNDSLQYSVKEFTALEDLEIYNFRQSAIFSEISSLSSLRTLTLSYLEPIKSSVTLPSLLDYLELCECERFDFGCLRYTGSQLQHLVVECKRDPPNFWSFVESANVQCLSTSCTFIRGHARTKQVGVPLPPSVAGVEGEPRCKSLKKFRIKLGISSRNWNALSECTQLKYLGFSCIAHLPRKARPLPSCIEHIEFENPQYSIDFANLNFEHTLRHLTLTDLNFVPCNLYTFLQKRHVEKLTLVRCAFNSIINCPSRTSVENIDSRFDETKRIIDRGNGRGP